MVCWLRQALFVVWTAKVSCSEFVTVVLDKQYVPVVRQNRTVMHKTAYFGKVYVGLPDMQEFSVVFDTGSGHLLLPSGACASKTCRQHRRFNRTASKSAIDIDHDGNPVSPHATDRDQVEIAFGTGEVVGDFVYETVCLQDLSGTDQAHQQPGCVQVRVILATEMTEEPFHAFQFDGVLGLGLQSLSVDPEFSVLRQMAFLKPQMDTQFGVYVSESDSEPSHISFGGHDERYFDGSLQWTNVNEPELGYWQLRIKSLLVGGIPHPLCIDGTCKGIMDTGTSLLGVPRAAVQDLNWKLARKVHDGSDVIDCRVFPGPELIFELEEFNISLGPADYSRPAATKVLNSTDNETTVICRASMLPVDMGPPMGSKTFILGEPALRRYYTAYDWGLQRIGLAPISAQRPLSERQHTVIGAPVSVPTPAVVQI
jgi:hypothetical protein